MSTLDRSNSPLPGDRFFPDGEAHASDFCFIDGHFMPPRNIYALRGQTRQLQVMRYLVRVRMN